MWLGFVGASSSADATATTAAPGQNTTRTTTGTPPYNHIWAYGVPKNVADFCATAQIVQFAQTRALFEGFRAFMWSRYSAVLVWKLQSPWPTMRGALYDYFLQVKLTTSCG